MGKQRLVRISLTAPPATPRIGLRRWQWPVTTRNRGKFLPSNGCSLRNAAPVPGHSGPWCGPVSGCPYGAALEDLGRGDDRETGRWLNNLAENSHPPFRRRERAMLRFLRMRTLQKFAAVHASVHNHFPTERHLQNRNVYK